jgi:transcriptional regulator with XRE-family HTH domain
MRGLSLRHLSKVTGISASTISRIENGRFSPTYDNTLRITSALGMDAVEIPAVFRAGATVLALAATRVADDHSSDGFPPNSLQFAQVNLTLTRLKKGQRKNLSKIAARTAAKEMLLLQGTVQARSNSGIRETLRPGARITCAAILRHTLFGDALSDAELLWIGN